jgi:Cdc6-like AAA superfamily ATPase
MPLRPSDGWEEGIPTVSWEDVAPDFIEAWGQGEHLITIGKTGRGKTTLINDVLDRRHLQREAKVCSFICKVKDDTSSDLLKKDWSKIFAWPPTFAQRESGKVMLWPKYTKASSYAKDARPTFMEAIDEIMEEGCWTLYLDEAPYYVESMGLRKSMDELFNQARSNEITLVAGTQRPVWVSRSMVSQHCWVACFRVGDIEDARRAGEVMGDRDRYTPVIMGLGSHQFILVDTIGDDAVISQVGT